ncbi:MAG: GNAT family N-acetyltransferase [Sphingobacterium thalpophilum]|jgi:GNAT superfamily N-acetyltransferase
MSVIIRVALKEDCKRLLELINELAVYEKAPNEVTVSLEEFESAGFGINPVWKAFVAELDGIILGFGLYYVRYSTWKGCRMYLEDLLITENMRGKGLGTMILNRLIEEAKEKKLKGMTWQVLDWNEPAINFYKKYKAEFDSGWINVSLSEDQVDKL